MLAVNGLLNTPVTDLDFSALMDAIEGPQLNTFLPGMDFKMPPNANLMLSEMKSAASIEPSGLLNTDGSPTVLQNMFGEIPSTEPLNDRLATIGYENMTPIAEISTSSFEFFIIVFGIISMFILFIWNKKGNSMLAGLWKDNFGDFVLWGTVINVILANYLPVLVATLISCVGV